MRLLVTILLILISTLSYSQEKYELLFKNDVMTADGVIEEIFRKTSLDKISKKYKSSCYSCEIGSIIFDDIDGKVQVKGYITFKIFFE